VAAAMAWYRLSCRKVIYDWLSRWDGHAASLEARSRRPHTHPVAHTPAEDALIREGMKSLIAERGIFYAPTVLYTWLRQHGYTRAIGGMKRYIRKNILTLSGKKAKKKQKKNLFPPKQSPGESIQIDVKYVPSTNNASGRPLYQYTAVDECTRYTIREVYEEHSTYSSKQFLEKVYNEFPFPIRQIQTDNGTEFTNALLIKQKTEGTLFEEALKELGIAYRRVRIATPQHNGKVERQHREDQRLLYVPKTRFHSLADARKKMAEYNAWSNTILRSQLGYRSPAEMIELYLYLL
jgi:transposase InsO family protein